MLDLDALAVFVAVVDAGIFAAAARRLALPTTRVSRKVQQLERDLDTRLFNRTARAVAATDTGRRPGRAARPFAGDRADLVRPWVVRRSADRISPEASGGRHRGGRLQRRAGHGPATARLRHPHRTATRFFIDRPAHHVCRVRQICRTRLLAALPDIDDTAALANAPCLATAYDGHALPWALTDGGRAVAHRPAGVYCAEDNALIRRAALAGIGLAWLPAAMVEDDIAAGRLSPVLPGHWSPPLDVYLAYPGRDRPDAKQRSFIRFIQKK